MTLEAGDGRVMDGRAFLVVVVHTLIWIDRLAFFPHFSVFFFRCSSAIHKHGPSILARRREGFIMVLRVVDRLKGRNFTMCRCYGPMRLAVGVGEERGARRAASSGIQGLVFGLARTTAYRSSESRQTLKQCRYHKSKWQLV